LVTDFMDIDKLFNRHKDFLDNNDKLTEFLTPQNIGYSNTLKSNIIVKLNKQSIVEETPYGLDIWLEDENKEQLYTFPTVRFGISDNKVYIYAIQNKNANNNNKIERILRKTGEGFDDINSDKDPIMSPENIYSVSPWALVASSIAISLIKEQTKIENFVAPYFLINRWNAVEVSYNILKNKYRDQENNPNINRILQKKEEQVSRHDELQRNITDKFIRTFRRLDHHFNNISITSLELEEDSCIHFQVNNNYSCNNSLLDEVYNLAGSYNKNQENFKNK